MLTAFLNFPSNRDALCCSRRWGEITSCLWTSVTNGRSFHPPDDMCVWKTTVEWYRQGNTKELGEKRVLVQLRPPQIPHGLTRARTQASAVRRRQLTAWAMARPTCICHTSFMEQGPFWGTDSRSASKEFLGILWKLNVHYRVHKRPPLDLSWVSHMIPASNSFHSDTTISTLQRSGAPTRAAAWFKQTQLLW
jgi:hypothetical protein